MRIIVVRHGRAKAKKGHLDGDDDRPLVARGRRQAVRLGKIIGRGKPTRVISSPALRCVETVQPLAEKRKLVVEVSEQLSRGAGPAAADLCRQPRGGYTGRRSWIIRFRAGKIDKFDYRPPAA